MGFLGWARHSMVGGNPEQGCGSYIPVPSTFSPDFARKMLSRISFPNNQPSIDSRPFFGRFPVRPEPPRTPNRRSPVGRGHQSPPWCKLTSGGHPQSPELHHFLLGQLFRPGAPPLPPQASCFGCRSVAFAFLRPAVSAVSTGVIREAAGSRACEAS